MASILTDLSDGIRRLQQLSKEMSEIELKEQIVHLKQLLVDAKIELLNRDERITELLNQAKKTASTVEVQGFRYDLVDGHPSGMPYCPTCETREGKLYRLLRRNANYSVCGNCKVTYNAGANGSVHTKDPPPNIPPRKPWISE